MSTIQQLQAQRRELARQANHLAAEKGAAIWSLGDQNAFDLVSQEIENVDKRIADLRRQQAESDEQTFGDARRRDPHAPMTPAQQGLDRFLRKSPAKWTPADEAVIQNAMSTTAGSSGGYTVQSDVAREFVDLMADYGGMRRVADRVVTSTGAPLSIAATDGRGEVGELLGENAAPASADLSFSPVALNTYKFSSKILTVPRELLADTSVDLVGLVERRLQDRIGRIENVKFTVGAGDGSLEPWGLTTRATVGVIGGTGSVLTVAYNDLVGVVESLDHAYLGQPGVTWTMGQTMRGMVRRLRDTSGRPIFLPNYGSADQDFTDALLGYPLTINNDMPTPAANATTISFGQHRKYMVRDVLEVELHRFDDSPHTSRGQVGFLAWARAGGNLLDTAAVRLYQHSAS